jgi:hypothetical protein
MRQKIRYTLGNVTKTISIRELFNMTKHFLQVLIKQGRRTNKLPA